VTQAARILVVDDERPVRFLLAEQLAAAGYHVSTAASGQEAINRVEDDEIDVVILDLRMGEMDGLRVMDALAGQTLPPQVVVLTGHASLDTAVATMRKGGCDYLSKPCRIEDLINGVERGLARRREVVQRCRIARLIQETARQLYDPHTAEPPPATPSHVLSRRDVCLDHEHGTATRAGKPLPLTPTEFDLLACLMERTDRPVSYRELAMALYGDGQERTEWDARASLGTHLWRLRRKLGDAADGHPYIVNVRGRGYKFVSAT
jgi:two-component system OmpR family response regulator